MRKHTGLFILGLGLMLFCASGDSFAAEAGVSCVLPDNGNEVPLTEEQCRKLDGVINQDGPVTTSGSAISATSAETQGRYKECGTGGCTYSDTAPVPPHPYGSWAPGPTVQTQAYYRVPCLQASLFGDYTKYVLLPYQPSGPIYCPEPGFAYSYVPAPYGYYGSSGIYLHFRFGHHHHR